jgi:hypothetical protein
MPRYFKIEFGSIQITEEMQRNIIYCVSPNIVYCATEADASLGARHCCECVRLLIQGMDTETEAAIRMNATGV